MALANFPKGFSNGVTIQGFPVAMLFATSQSSLGNTAKTGVYWVDSNNGLDGNTGTYQLPLATVGRAFALASANDIIVCKPGHAETISSATAASGAWNVAGVTVVGLGVGTQRPSFTLDTVNTSTINVSANNIRATNVQFIANFLNIAALFTITTAKGFTVDNCEIRDTSASLNFLDVFSVSTTSNAADALRVSGNDIFLAATSGVVRLLNAAGTNDRVKIDGNTFRSATTNSSAVIPIASGKVLTNFALLNNYFDLQNAAGTGTGYILTTNGSTNSGFIHGNYDHSLPTTPLFCTASSGFVYGLNYHSDVADLAGYLVPAADV